MNKESTVNQFEIKLEFLKGRNIYKVSISPGTCILNNQRNPESIQLVSTKNEAIYYYESFRKYAEKNQVKIY